MATPTTATATTTKKKPSTSSTSPARSRKAPASAKKPRTAATTNTNKKKPVMTTPYDEPRNTHVVGQIHTAASRLGGDSGVPSAQAEADGIAIAVAVPEISYTDDDLVAVSIGFGVNDRNSQGFWVGAIRFEQSRIARNVRYEDAIKMQKSYTPRTKGSSNPVRIHPNDASEPEIAKRCGVRAGDPAKIAAQLLAAIDQDPETFFGQFRTDELLALAQKIGERAVAVNQ
jgi:hypothetical protein